MAQKWPTWKMFTGTLEQNSWKHSTGAFEIYAHMMDICTFEGKRSVHNSHLDIGTYPYQNVLATEETCSMHILCTMCTLECQNLQITFWRRFWNMYIPKGLNKPGQVWRGTVHTLVHDMHHMHIWQSKLLKLPGLDEDMTSNFLSHPFDLHYNHQLFTAWILFSAVVSEIWLASN